MAKENLIHRKTTQKTVVNVLKTILGAQLLFSDGSSVYMAGVIDIQVDGDIITIYRGGEKKHSVDFTIGTLDKYATASADALVIYWLTNGFFLI